MMTRFYFTLLSIAVFFSSFGQCEDGRYRDMIFPGHTLTSDILYGNNIDNNGDAQDLFLDVYEPEGDTETDRALIIIAHGGSFVSGSKTGADVVPFCEDMARLGYVVASIQYRLGIAISFDPSQDATEAVVRGFHDGKAATRFFRKDVAENGNTYGIDESRIFMAGVSAGGFIALHNAYMDNIDEIPAIVDTTTAGLGGGIEGLSGNAGYSSELAGIINIAGALNDVQNMEANDPPVCSFHGNDDGTVPFDTDMLQLLGTIDITIVDGSETVHAKADELGLINCFQVQEGQGHVPHVTNVLYYDTLRSISSNFLSHLICPATIPLDCDYREINIVSSLDELASNGLSITLYPNPVQDVLHVGNIPINGSTVNYEIIDLTGQVAKRGRLERNLEQVYTDELTNGIYLMKVSDGLSTHTTRFVKN
jgi:poly(3-hydroxybutyrate) depolymerase